MKTALLILRTRCNYTQAMLARELNVSRQMIYAWEQGNKQIPDSRVTQLAALFGAPPEMILEQDNSVVESWCDRPLFSYERHGRQVFSFTPNEAMQVVLSGPEEVMPDTRCRQLTAQRGKLMQQLMEQTSIAMEDQTDELRRVESSLDSLRSVSQIFRLAEGESGQWVLEFLSEELSVLAEVLAGVSTQENEADWRIQRRRQLRTRWAECSRERASKRREYRWAESKQNEPPEKFAQLIDQWYKQARSQGAGRDELQELINRIIQEEYKRGAH